MRKLAGLLALRCREGIKFFDYFPPYNFLNLEDDRLLNKDFKDIFFSEDGKYFYWIDNKSVNLIELDEYLPKPDGDFKFIYEHKNIREASLSPLSNFMIVCIEHSVQDCNQNVMIYSIKGNLIKSFCIPKLSNWDIQWSKDEKYLSKYMDDNFNIVGIYDSTTLDKPLAKTPNNLTITKYAISPRASQIFIATFTRGSKDNPSQLRLLQFPEFVINQFPSKNFFGGDECQFFWNNNGLSVLALVTYQVDKTNKSYYGKQSLFLLSAKKDGLATSFTEFENPIYALAWRPQILSVSAGSKQHPEEKNAKLSPVRKGGGGNSPTKLQESFVVIYGKMPSAALLLNEQGEKQFDFGRNNRNGCYFAPQGHLLALTGSGNVHGNIEFWELKTGKGDCKLINKLNFNKLIPTLFEWCPDGEHILIATTSPRLRMENGFSIYHYTGALIYRSEEIVELYDLKWRPPYQCQFPAKEISYKLVKSNVEQSVAQEAHKFVTDKEQTYVPPHLRNASDRQSTAPPPPFPLPKALRTKIKQQKPAVIISDPKDTVKRARNIRKKLKQIRDLKEEQNSGKTLDQSQIDKIASEKKLLDELKQLAITDEE